MTETPVDLRSELEHTRLRLERLLSLLERALPHLPPILRREVEKEVK